MDALTDALARDLRRRGGIVETGVRALSVSRDPSGWRVRLANGTDRRSEALLAALPAPAASGVLAGLDAALSAPLGEIEMGSATVVIVGFGSQTARVPEASGWLVPRREGGPVQAVTMLSRKHPGTAPEGHDLARVFLRPAFAHSAQNEARAAAVHHLRERTGWTGEPVWTAVHRWTDARPRYTLGHPERLAALDAALVRHPGLAIAGASLRGVGLPDVIARAHDEADALLSSLSR